MFTASQKEYADAILDHLDPDGSLIHHRFYRDSCIYTENPLGNKFYVKDLRIFENFDLKDIVIVDNAIYSFINQLENGIPIIPFRWDREDDQLDRLIEYMPKLANESDVWTSISRNFKL